MLGELLVFPGTVLLSEDVVLVCADKVGVGSVVLVELFILVSLAGGADVVWTDWSVCMGPA